MSASASASASAAAAAADARIHRLGCRCCPALPLLRVAPAQPLPLLLPSRVWRPGHAAAAPREHAERRRRGDGRKAAALHTKAVVLLQLMLENALVATDLWGGPGERD